MWLPSNLRRLAAIIPWEGIRDYYRDRCRHGGSLSILSTGCGIVQSVRTPWEGSRGLIHDTVEGELPDHRTNNANNRCCDVLYYASKEYSLNEINVPLLSAANLGDTT